MKVLALFSGMVALVACTSVNQPPKQPISFAGEPQIFQALLVADTPERTSWRYRLKNNAILHYTMLKTGTLPGTMPDVDVIRTKMKDKFYQDKGVVFEGSTTKNIGPLVYVMASSDQANCFILDRSFGEGGGRGNQEIYLDTCYSVTSKSASDTEREMVDIAERIRVNGAPVP